jgi:hypothetical protein
MMDSVGSKVVDDMRYKNSLKIKRYWLGANDLKKEGK